MMRCMFVAMVAAAFSLTATAQNSFDQKGQAPASSSSPPGYAQGPRNSPAWPQANTQAGNELMAGASRNGGAFGAANDAMTREERQDFGVPPTRELRSEPMHAPTPNSIPGGQVITTPGLVALLQSSQVRALVFDVLGGQETLPGALYAAPASQAGSFQDATQQQFGQFLQQQTQGRRDVPLVFYCQSSHCWMSYNAALRAISLGYSNVLWYRGGIQAWQRAGQPTQQAHQAPNTPMPQTPPTGNGYAPAAGYQSNNNYQQTGNVYPSSAGQYRQ